jgi:hypothetical protein
VRHSAKLKDVASGAHAAIVKRDWGALQALPHPYLQVLVPELPEIASWRGGSVGMKVAGHA